MYSTTLTTLYLETRQSTWPWYVASPERLPTPYVFGHVGQFWHVFESPQLLWVGSIHNKWIHFTLPLTCLRRQQGVILKGWMSTYSEWAWPDIVFNVWNHQSSGESLTSKNEQMCSFPFGVDSLHIVRLAQKACPIVHRLSIPSNYMGNCPSPLSLDHLLNQHLILTSFTICLALPSPWTLDQAFPIT